MKRRIWIPIGITVVTVGFLFTLFDPREILESFRSMDWRFMAAALATHGLTYYFRAMTFSLMIPNRPVSARNVYWLHCTHNFLNMVLPARTGEVSYVVLLKTRHGVPAAHGLSSLLVTRILDLATVPVFFALGLILWGDILVGTGETSVYWKFGAAAVVLVLIGVVLVALPRISALAWVAVERLLSVFGLRRNSKAQRLLEKGDELTTSLRDVGGPDLLLRAGAWAMAARFANFLMLYLSLRGGGFLCEFWQKVLGSTAAIITNVLPVNGVGSFGPFEGGWAVGFVLVGFTRELALRSGFFVHIMALVYAAALFVIAWARGGFLWYRRTRETQRNP